MKLLLLGLLFATSNAFAVGSQTTLSSDQLDLANALFQNQQAINTALTKAGVTDAVDFLNGTATEGASPAFQSQGYNFTVEHCVDRIPTPTCTTLGTLSIVTTTQLTPGGPMSHTGVTFAPSGQ